MTKIKILIIEDDILYASKLEIALQELGYEVVCIVDNYSEAIKCFYATNPDIIIIDISLEGKYDGIKFAEQIKTDQKNIKPFIYLTASEDKETFQKAKSTSPCAFLLKPFDKRSLEYSIELALDQFANETTVDVSEIESSYFIKENIFIKKNKKIIKIPIVDILYIEVEAKYSMLYTVNNNKFILRVSLKEIMSLLKKEYLIRVHRNYLVNSNKISEFDMEEELIMINENKIPIGKSYKKWIMDSLVYFK